jgi:very-short-patch-repair endonuclease
MDSSTRRRLAQALASDQEGVVSRRGLAQHGVTRHHIRTEVSAGRWRTLGQQTVAVHCGPLPVLARRWHAVWETGVAIAAIDGVTALQHGGLTGFDDDRIHVSAVHHHNTSPIAGAVIHKVIRRVSGELAAGGLPRTRPEVAAIRAAHWAASNRQAALILLMTVQQRLTTPARLAAAQRLVRGRTRRRFIREVVRDIAFGVQSLGELDFARLCRERGLPEPFRQEVRQGPTGRIYLDVRWKSSQLVVEIDGAQHRWGLAVTIDNLRQNAVTLSGDRVLRIDIIGLRLESDLFMDQVAQGLARLAAEWMYQRVG